MIRSMTGYARARSESGSYVAEIELRSVNHRYQDIRVKAPSSVAQLETKVRSRIAARIKRGKVDVSVRIKPLEESAFRLELDRPLMEEFVKSARRMGEELNVPGDLTLSDLVGFHAALGVKERDLVESDSVWATLCQVVDEALDAHDRMSAAEGAQLTADLDERLKSITEHIDAVETLSSKSKKRRHRELVERVEELEVGGLEPSALTMEVARLVERSDITEELIRLRSHFVLWSDAVAGIEPCGKKLDFIIQEMNREVNTIGSKSQDANITERVIGVKTELERMREQVQNIQ